MPSGIPPRLAIGHLSLSSRLISLRTPALLAPPQCNSLKDQAISSLFASAGRRRNGGKNFRLHSLKSGGSHDREAFSVWSGDVDQNSLREGQREDLGGFGMDADILDEGVRLRLSVDRWIEGCVCDIVRNIEEAPFLHMLFLSDDTAALSQRHKVSSCRGAEDGWEEYVREFVSRASPDGVILVHNLDDDEGGCGQCGHSHGRCPATDRFWGVLVLGKSIAASACYILKTTSLSSSVGTCTVFCLTKAKCFGPSWYRQMQSCWLSSAEGETASN